MSRQRRKWLLSAPFDRVYILSFGGQSLCSLLGCHGGADCEWKNLSGSTFSGDREPPPFPSLTSTSPLVKAFPAQTLLWLHLLLCCELGLFQAAKSESSCSVVETFNKCSYPFTACFRELYRSRTAEA